MPPDLSEKPDVSGPRVGLIVAVVLAVVLVGWVALRGGDDDSSSSSSAAGGAEAVSADTLRDRATELGRPIYWAGEEENATLELTEESGGEVVYVRYLTGGVEPGGGNTGFLTVGTYAFADPVSALEVQSEQPGGEISDLPGGGVVYHNRDTPNSFYLAFPGVELQVEVYDPDPERARELVRSGQIVPVS